MCFAFAILDLPTTASSVSCVQDASKTFETCTVLMKVSPSVSTYSLESDISVYATGAVRATDAVVPVSSANPATSFSYKVYYTTVQKTDTQLISVSVVLSRTGAAITNSPVNLTVPAQPYDATQSPVTCDPYPVVSDTLTLHAGFATTCTIIFKANNLPTTAYGMLAMQ